MEKNRFKRILAALLSAVMFLSSPASVFAESGAAPGEGLGFLDNVQTMAEGMRLLAAAPEEDLKLSTASLTPSDWYKGIAAKSDVQTITFAMNATPSELEMEKAWDVTSDGTGSIMAWYSNNVYRNVVVGVCTDSYIRANAVSSDFIAGFPNLKSVDMSVLYTGDVTTSGNFMHDDPNLEEVHLGEGWTANCLIPPVSTEISDGKWHDVEKGLTYTPEEIPAGKGSYYMIRMYWVNFEMNGHDTAHPVQPQRVYAGKVLTKPADPVEYGYLFQGWFREQAFKNKWDFEQDIVEKAMTLYAKWAIPDTKLAPGATWYKGKAEREYVTKITFTKTYTPTGKETEVWNADASNNGGIKCYIISKGTEKEPAYELIINNYFDDGQTYLNADSSQLFMNFAALKEIEGITYLNSQYLTNCYHMFDGCSSLTSLDTSFLNTENVTNMEGMFRGCSTLPELDLSDLNVQNVTNMTSMFEGCSSLPEIDLSAFGGTPKLYHMAAMFNGCSSVTSLDLSRIDPKRVDDMNSLFKDCRELTSLTLGNNFTTEKVENMSRMYSGCEKLSDIDLSKFTTDLVKDMSYMFNDCAAVQSLNLSTFATPALKQMQSMFSGCKNLTEIVKLSNLNTSKVTEMECLFYECSALTNLDISTMNTSSCENMWGMFYKCLNLEQLTLGDPDTSKVEYMDYMFFNCPKLTSLDTKKLETGNVLNMRYMFYHCSGLTSLDLSSFDTSKVTGFSEMFDCCSSLSKLDLHNFNTASATKMDGMFANCTSLEELDISNFDTSGVKAGFTTDFTKNCTVLGKVKVGTGWAANMQLQINAKATDGRWHSTNDPSKSYLPTKIPAGKADTYTATIIYRKVSFNTMDPRPVSSRQPEPQFFQPDDGYYPVGSVIAPPSTLALKGYAFDAWYKDEACTQKWLFDGDFPDTMPNEDITLYAKWNASQYRLKFLPNHKDVTGTMDLQTVTYGVSTPISANKFSYVGHTFKGWNQRADGMGTSYEDKQPVLNITYVNDAEIEMYAQWTTNKYSIGFLKNADDATGTMADMTDLEYGSRYKLTANSYRRRGYTFSGWSENADGTGKQYNDRHSVVSLSTQAGARVLMHAKWTLTNYTISYVLDGGSNSDQNPLTYTMASDDITFLPAVRSGFEFGGWYSDTQFTRPVTGIAKGSVGNRTLYAKWTEAGKKAPAKEEKKSEPVQEEKKSEPVQEEKKSEPVQEEKKSEPVQEEKKSEPVQEEKKSEPVQEEKKSEPVQEEKKSEPVKEEKSSGGGSAGGFSGGSSGGSSGGGTPAAAAAPKLAAAPKPAQVPADLPSYVKADGNWNAAPAPENGEVTNWTYTTNDGKKVTDSWECIFNPYADTASGQRAYDWFRFDPTGNMMTGWFTDADGNQYYLNPASDGSRGKMVTGWFRIGDLWYLFNNVEGSGTMGALLKVSDKPE